MPNPETKLGKNFIYCVAAPDKTTRKPENLSNDLF
ncbi:hypothetical protein HNQ92_000386 [Rhabdobacter roseus]|uniref:Uncharacterized protein n=1 Tax=Rhabdobacter roseus TaxID=1655419 RepID=A0A840TH29_9BACT|nr:hypothetical protein [Rhabdobacter roseus]